MNYILHDHLSEFVMIYLDDIVIYFKSMTEHIKYLNWVFGQLKWVGLKIKVEKYKFTKPEIKLLSHQILAENMIPNPDKVVAIKVLEWSIIISKLKGFLGVIGFFRKYI